MVTKDLLVLLISSQLSALIADEPGKQWPYLLFWLKLFRFAEPPPTDPLVLFMICWPFLWKLEPIT